MLGERAAGEYRLLLGSPSSCPSCSLVAARAAVRRCSPPLAVAADRGAAAADRPRLRRAGASSTRCSRDRPAGARVRALFAIGLSALVTVAVACRCAPRRSGRRARSGGRSRRRPGCGTRARPGCVGSPTRTGAVGRRRGGRRARRRRDGGDRARAARPRAVAGRLRGRLPTTDELEGHGRPGRALRAALDAARARPRRVACAAIVGRTGTGSASTRRSRTSARGRRRRRQPGRRGGVPTLKLKAGAERETEVLVDRVRAVREAVGPDVAAPARRERRLGPGDGGGAARRGRRGSTSSTSSSRWRATTRRRWPSSGGACGSRSPPTRPSRRSGRRGRCSMPGRSTCSS